MPSTWGKIFKVSTYGESHGVSVGVVVEGVPAGLPFPLDEIQKDLTRRRPGQNDLTTPRDEEDLVIIESGVFQDKTTGSPILLKVNNKNTIGLFHGCCHMAKKFCKSFLCIFKVPNHFAFSFQNDLGLSLKACFLLLSSTVKGC